MTSSGWRTRHGAVVVGNRAAMRGHNAAVAARVKEAEQAFEAGDYAKARQIAETLLVREPGHARGNFIAGVSRHRSGDSDGALAPLLKALKADDRAADHTYAIAVVLNELRRNDEAAAYAERALDLAPDDARIHFRMGLIRGARGQRVAERESLERSVALDPDQRLSRNALGNVLRNDGELLSAVRHYAHAARVEPLESSSYGNAAVSLQELGELSRSIELARTALAIDPFNRIFHSNHLLARNYAHDLSGSDLAAMHRQFGALIAWTRSPASPGVPAPGARLRVGLLSPDYRQHPVASFIEPLLEHGHGAGMDLFCYSDTFLVDAITSRLAAHPVAWRDVAALDDDATARLIESDALDVLLELSGHTGANRLSLYVRRPATVQGSWLGYTFSTGLRDMDLRITDAICDPGPEDDALYQEKLLRVDAPFICFRRPAVEPRRSDSEDAAGGAVRFICLNNVAKMSPPLLAAWSRILAAVPDATLTCKSRLFVEPATRDRVRARFAACGIDTSRVRLDATVTSFEAHLRYYDAADIALDTFPYNGTTTSCEALWMGVPLVALRGRMHAGRVGASLLSALGLESDLVADDIDGYVARAVELARDRAGTRALAEQVRVRMRASPLVDEPGFARRLDRALRGELHARREAAAIRWVFVIGMSASGARWTAAALEALLEASGPVVVVDGDDEAALSGAVDGHTGVRLARIRQPSETVSALLRSGAARAVMAECEPVDVLAATMQRKEQALATVHEAAGTIVRTRNFWRSLPFVHLVQERDIARLPAAVATRLARWLGLCDEAFDAQALVRRIAPLTTSRAVAGAAGAPASADPALGDAPAARLPPALRARLHDAVAQAERAVVPLAAHAQTVPALAVRAGVDTWLQLPPDIRELSTFVMLEQGDWFEDELPFMRRYLQPGMCMLDVGANHGVFALSAARATGPGGRVCAIEPGLEPAARLLRASLVPGGAAVDVIRAAAGRTDGTTSLSVEPQSELRRTGGGSAAEQVVLRSLDSVAAEYDLRAVDYVKIDVEGAEEDVVLGGLDWLVDAGPLVQVEVRDTSRVSFDPLYRLREAGFEPYRLVPGLQLLCPIDIDGGPEGSRLDDYALNLFACPPARARELAGRGLLLRADDAPPALPSTPDWRAGIARAPFARRLLRHWEQGGLEQAGAADLREALAWHAAAHDGSLSPACALKAIEHAAALVAPIADSPLRQLTLVTLLLELGERLRAANLLAALLNALPDVGDPAAEPFLCPLADYAAMRPAEPAQWLHALIRSAWLRVGQLSAFFAGAHGREVVRALQATGINDARARRTALLYQQVDSRAEPDPRRWPAALIHEFRMLPNWPADA